MFTSAWFWICIVILPAVGALLVYNRFIKYSNRVREAWSGIDVQLKRRHELIPRLVAVVKGYAAHEAELLDEVTRLRTESLNATDIPASETAEQQLSLGLRPLLAIAEAYPELKANENYLQLQNELSEVENMLQLARRYYNGTVRDLNNLVEMFPSNLVARLCGFRVQEFFEIDVATEREAPQIDMNGDSE